MVIITIVKRGRRFGCLKIILLMIISYLYSMFLNMVTVLYRSKYKQDTVEKSGTNNQDTMRQPIIT